MEAYRRVHESVNILFVGSFNSYITVDNAVRGIYAVRITAKIPDSLYDELANQGIVVCGITDVSSPLVFLSDIHFTSHAPSSSRKIDRGLLLNVYPPNIGQGLFKCVCIHPLNFFLNVRTPECREGHQRKLSRFIYVRATNPVL